MGLAYEMRLNALPLGPPWARVVPYQTLPSCEEVAAQYAQKRQSKDHAEYIYEGE